jgi:hypothetical protein
MSLLRVFRCLIIIKVKKEEVEKKEYINLHATVVGEIAKPTKL